MRGFISGAPRHQVVGVRATFYGRTNWRAGEAALKALEASAKGAALIGAVTVVGHSLWLAFAYLTELVRG